MRRILTPCLSPTFAVTSPNSSPAPFFHFFFWPHCALPGCSRKKRRDILRSLCSPFSSPEFGFATPPPSSLPALPWRFYSPRPLSRGAAISTGAKAPWGSALLVLGSVATVMMLRLTAPLWNLLPKMRFVQFPWRWMSIVAVVCSCFLAAAIERRRGWLWFVLVAILSFPLGYFLTQNTWWDPDEMSTQLAPIKTSTVYEGVDEYDPLGDDHLDLPKA